MKHRALILVALLCFCTALQAQVPPAATVRRPADAGDGTVVIPERFLRSWDPVTIFYEHDVGGASGTSEDRPGGFATMTPDQPGAYTWINRRTLQFRPADAWPPLQRVTVAVGGREVVLHTLMAAPVETIPAAHAEGLEPISAITLSFAQPVAAGALERMVTIELRLLPGVGEGPSRWLTGADFEVKSLERASPSSPATYVLVLASPIAAGTRVVVHFRLALDDDSESSFAEISFATAEPFRVLSVGSHSNRYPVTPKGSHYTEDQALNAGSDARTVVVELSAAPGEVTPVQARRLLRFTPAVAGLDFRVAGRSLEISGDFRWDTLYRLELASSPLVDRGGRPLQLEGNSSLYLYFPRRPAYLEWDASHGVVERFGPKMVPVQGRGFTRFDLRLYPVDPLDRSFWPFPEQAVLVDERERPPGPGEAPASFEELRHIHEHELRGQLRALGSPPVSAIVDAPLTADGGAAHFGLDLEAHLEALAGARRPGHYLLGLRPLDAGGTRQWMRVQVTDLSLSTVEEAHAVRFVVTSLSSGRPVAGAEVRVEAAQHQRSQQRWLTLTSGSTDADGAFRWQPSVCRGCSVLRIVVAAGEDVLVLDPTRAPDAFADGTWFGAGETWLQWTTEGTGWRGPQPEEVSHVFTERPVYRPDEPVHIKGYVRERVDGALRAIALSKTFVVVDGPGDLEWRFPVEMTDAGSFAWTFAADNRPTGEYSAYLEGWRPDRDSWFYSLSVDFLLEAYRIPRFEVNLHAPDKVAMDTAFDVTMTATYYAGGRVADRPVEWRVTQFPYTWKPAAWEGFFFSSDGRFSRTERFEASAAVDRIDRTDDEGSSRLRLDPTVEATAQPRTYVIEATVTGADDQTVTSTRRVLGLPPFVLGLKVPRYLERAAQVEPEVLVLGLDEQPVAGQRLNLRLKKRQWHSYLRASDFSDGEARYITDVVDEVVFETEVESLAEILRTSLPIDEAGVYVVELEASDRVGRTQVVAVDLYAGGDEPVSWSKPTARTFKVSTDRDAYGPGDEAVFVLESPYQNATALVVVEAPEGNRYQWLPVSGGSATYRLGLENTWAPRLPVHFVLMRGRVNNTAPLPGSATDLGKPATIATTVWVEVDPRANRLVAELDHPERALPGEEVEVTIRLRDPDGRPLAGEVTLWLVDQAVLALGREQRLDPMPDFVTPVASHTEFRDTRHLPFGHLPFAENPGGGEAAMGEGGILDRATVRRNFQPVPFYDPLILVGPDGVATVRVQLPDNLTNFKLRAKVVSGVQRFGFATGHLAVRLPLIVQPALPRFVRPGDAFTGAAIGRVVEGEGGPGGLELRLEGVELEGAATREVMWVPNQAQRLDFQVRVPTPTITEEGELERQEAVFTVAVARQSDGASDAFELRLPIRDDRRRVTDRLLTELEPGVAVSLPEVNGAARPGSVRRTLLASNQPGLVRMAAGLNFLLEYPFGCTEQRMSRARAWMAMEKFRDLFNMQAPTADLQRAVDDVLQWMPQVIEPSGLVAYWPGSRGYVALTAWSLDFLVEARAAGFTVEPALFDGLVRTLEQSLRSDYSRFIDGESFAERCWALSALTRAGRFNAAYAAELARRAQFLNLEASAKVLQSFVVAGSQGAPIDELADKLWNGLVVRLWQGREIYAGLQDSDLRRNGLILPTESRSLAEVTRALAGAGRGDPRFQVLVNGLVTLGRNDGWGSTNANAAALLALAEVMEAPAPGTPERALTLDLQGAVSELRLTPASPALSHADGETGPWSLRIDSDAGGTAVVVRAECSWLPAEDGSRVASESSGFVVTRVLEHHRGGDQPPRRLALEAPALQLELEVGDVVEDHVQLVNPEDRFYVAVVVPLAAGMEPLNPRLATAPPEATPSGSLTMAPSYAAYMDDHVAFYYDELPSGTYDFYFRTRATVPGRFIQPAAAAELMYDGAVRGNGNGAVLLIARGEEED